MEFLIPLLKIIHIFVSVVLILIILLQPSNSGDLGSMFGGGTSESVFGSSGAVPFLAKLTRLIAAVFIITSLTLGYFSVKSISSSVVQDSVVNVEENIDTTTEELQQEVEPSEFESQESKE
ncbi:MAG: preprotein translocase subunit SecG [Candidatus Dadabacteria bacterium]|nr:preprotein translocase subunit SecG [Candidatus Dadabacteria bacterium]NIQ15142.1 preprotein translocase subunit SecG [Candidatus Dadabacteria bacterium]